MSNPFLKAVGVKETTKIKSTLSTSNPFLNAVTTDEQRAVGLGLASPIGYTGNFQAPLPKMTLGSEGQAIIGGVDTYVKPKTAGQALKESWASTVQSVKNIIPSLSGKPTAKSVINDILNTPEETLAQKGQRFYDATIGTIVNAAKQDATNIKNYWDIASNKQSSLTQKAGAGLKLVAGQAGLLFSPISALFGLAEQLPIVGTAVKMLGTGFAVSGDVFKNGFDNIVEMMPIPEQDKANLKEGGEEVASLAGQIIAGGKLFEALLPNQKIALKKKFGEDGANKIIELAKKKAESTPEEVKVQMRQNTPEANPFLKAVKTEAYTRLISQKELDIYNKTGELPANADNQTLIIKPGQEKNILGVAPDKQYRVTFKPSVEEKITSSDTTMQASVTGKIPKSDVLKVEPLTQEAGKVSGVAKNIEAKAIEQKLTTGYKDLAEYDASTFAIESKKAADLINSGIEKARAVVRGEELTDIKAGALIAGMEEYAKTHPSEAGNILQELANSKLASTISTGASELSFSRMREQGSASTKLSEVKKTYESKVTNLPKKKTELGKSLKSETEKFNLTKEERSFNNFLDKIIC